MELNADQASAFGAVKSGRNIFLTGPAGSGKTFLIRRIQEWAESVAGKTIAITALTGCAALLLSNKAKTLHSWAGIGLGKETADVLSSNITKNPHKKRRWKKTDILVIDEISMMTPELFEKLDIIGKRVRASTDPFGGIQVVICGDFFQLPPVVKGISGETAPGRFAFESPVWRSAAMKPVVLSKIERQTDVAFQRLLNECRIGEPSAETIALLKSRQGLDWKSKFIRPTLLFSRNADVDTINEKNIAALGKALHPFEAKTVIDRSAEHPEVDMPSGEEVERLVARLDNDANYASHLDLCVGAQVMLLINKDLEAGQVNGSRGVITEFTTEGHPVVQFLHGAPVVVGPHEWVSNECPHLARTQIPLRVAYAVTIHKSQGATLDCALIDIGTSTFEYGQAYVALSRVRNLDSLYIHTLSPAKIKAHPSVVRFYEHLLEVEDTPSASAGRTAPPSDFGTDLADEGWRSVVTTWAASMTGFDCLAKVAERRTVATVYPPPSDVLNAIRMTPLNKVKVVILGQDPYHGPGQAHGLSFSVLAGSMPPSLKNIRRELLADLGLTEAAWPLTRGDLRPWVAQGVLLMNAVLTVEAANPDSHAGIGWEDLTSRLLGAVIAARTDDPVVVVAWGRKAQAVAYKLRLGPKHVVVEGVHPSPLSAHSGFFGSKPFSKVNASLTAAGATPVDWRLITGGVASEDPV